ncbi:hypothetical protein G6F57_010507 [Rhizopus arrhizus]|nr:hypothetical protein G6F21_006261 [Rhizopus arrhizus]KAG0794120.1 hypothetical protein G6F22_005433 [Rhizopus arrhizus]KAG0831583.1 hypothetical protein G6F19_006657 [Rhizopus arrhizus]KAG0832051.1 hypothetical protein G6F18_007390 [Rhizopus arrhizus]KAG0896263.1 hypothetical protein G6F34_007506 [Rhizopus arrhizus]
MSILLLCWHFALANGGKSKERSNTYFYRCLRQRQQQQYISSIRTDPGIVVTEPLDLTETAHEYYEQLCSPEPMDEQATSDLLAHVPESASISPDVHESLINYWTVDEHFEKASIHQLGNAQ